ncbi:serine hydrolase domain-containing protein [Cohnella faecalis]|uniref:Beta-lactamase-related domain-containing protein n=2 Tax=Cohnella faecalis TaxID=2315694 RepID=A0A398CH35_9BACL|nr:serine hydrolase [Cohnella faecalis]RIE01780.1 hypothetical protein D3H35_13340 [Cohnella faecalis]
MGRFMRAFLNGGELTGQRILQNDAVADMTSLHASFNPALGGMGYGFYMNERSGMRILQHGGAIPGWHSILWIIPELNIGVFVAVNGEGEPGLPDELMNTFLNENVTWTTPAFALESGQSSNALSSAKYAGRYILNRHLSDSVFKIATLWQDIRLKVAAIDDGSLLVSGTDYSCICTNKGSGLWHNTLGTVAFASYENDDGFYLQLSGNPTADYRRMAWYEDEKLHLAVAAGFGLLFVLGTLAWIGFSLRFRKLWRSIPGIVCGIYVIFIAGILAELNTLDMGSATPASFYFILSLPIISALLIALELVRWVYEWRQRKIASNRSAVAIAFIRLGRGLLITAQIAFLIYLNYWNMLGWSGLE